MEVFILIVIFVFLQLPNLLGVVGVCIQLEVELEHLLVDLHLPLGVLFLDVIQCLGAAP